MQGCVNQMGVLLLLLQTVGRIITFHWNQPVLTKLRCLIFGQQCNPILGYWDALNNVRRSLLISSTDE
uniref:Secreted protein n=1 Tax=Arundo donax TaxID=35708 RepID=A0A0A9A043_ARUDO